MSARLRFGAQQQPCRIKSCFSASTEARGSSTATVTLEMFKRSAEIQMKLSLPCLSRRGGEKKSHTVVEGFSDNVDPFFRLLYFFQTILFWWWCNRRATTQQTLLTSCIIKICSHYATSLMVSVRGILTTKWWHSCMGISLFCSNNYNDHLLDFISTSSTIIDTKGLDFKSCYKLTNIWCIIKKVSFLKSLT